MNAASPKPDSKRVLVVDDDPDIADSIRFALQNRGYNVLLAGDGNEGIALAENEPPDLVILDMMMPNRSGILVLEYLRETVEQSPIPVIMITGNEGRRHRQYAELLGVVDYIQKPFAMDRLLESVDRALT